MPAHRQAAAPPCPTTLLAVPRAPRPPRYRASVPAPPAPPAPSAPPEPAPPSRGRGLWLAPAPPPLGWRGFFSSERAVIYLVVPLGMLLLMSRIPLEWQRARDLGNGYLLMVTAMVLVGGMFELCYGLWARAVVTPPARWQRLLAHAATWLVASVAGTYLASWVIDALWGLPAERFRDQSVRPAIVIGGVVIAITMFADERRAAAARLEQRAAAAHLAALRAELSALQSRTDPHFLFNSLNAVASLIPDDPASAESMLERLATVFRYALDAGRHPLVPLAAELSAIRTYLSVEEVRFGDRLRWHVHEEDGLGLLPIPPLSLQPLVENALHHGASARRGATIVAIAARRQRGHIVLSVEDQPAGGGGGEVRTSPPGAGSALANLRARLALLHGEAAAVQAGPHGEGWRVTIELPATALVGREAALAPQADGSAGSVEEAGPSDDSIPSPASPRRPRLP